MMDLIISWNDKGKPHMCILSTEKKHSIVGYITKGLPCWCDLCC